MNIAYFSNQFADRDGHGIARYSRELFRAVTAQKEVRLLPVAAWSNLERRSLDNLADGTGLRLLPWGRRMTPLSWALFNRPALERWMDLPVDVVHATSLGYPIATRKPFVVTVHDIGPLTHPEYFGNKPSWIMKASLKQAVRKADALVCVSRSTADELVGYVGEPIERRVHVIHEGVGGEFFLPSEKPAANLPFNLPSPETPFILSTGKISPRKNIQGLVSAFGEIVDKIPHHLVLVGGDGWDMDQVRGQLGDPRLARRVHTPGYVTDSQLRELYRRASVYVHPSFYEGFGLTVLEAMASGCPVVTSSLYSLPEVAGDAALLVDPANTDEIAHAIETLCLDRELAADYAERGKQRAATFRWDDCARRIINVYRNVCGG